MSHGDRGKGSNPKGNRKAVVDHIRDLLDKTSERIESDSGNVDCWQDVLSNLEGALEEAETLLPNPAPTWEKVEPSLADLLPPRPSVDEQLFKVPPLPPEKLELERPPEEGYAAAVRVLRIPMEELATLSLQDIALAKSYLTMTTKDNKPLSHAQKTLASRIELANQLHGSDPGAFIASPEERRKQAVLRHAVDKISDGDFEGLTVKELDVITNSYTLLNHRITLQGEDERLLRLLQENMESLEKRCHLLKDRLQSRRNSH